MHFYNLLCAARVSFAFMCTLSMLVYSGMVWAEAQPLRKSFVMGILPDKLKFETKKTTGAVALKDAISLALLRNPELEALSLEIRAQEARALQAGLFPNPEIGFEAENLGGTGGFRNFESAETTIQLSQLIELGGKRSKRRRMASLKKGLSEWDYGSKRADVLTKVAKAFVDVLASQEYLVVTDELVGLAEKILNTVSARVKAGKVSPVEETRARVMFSMSRITYEHARQKLEASRKRLSATWGEETPLFEEVDGELDVIRPIPSIAEIEGLISQNPDIARWVTEKEQHRANVAFEDAGRISDPTISLGVRNFNETDDNSFTLAVSIPLPIFDRNQGGSLEARHKLARANRENQVARMVVLNDLAEAYQSFSSAYAEATALKTDVLPGAQSAFD